MNKRLALTSHRVADWARHDLLAFFFLPDNSKDGVGNHAYERRDNQYRHELTHDATLRVHSLD
ncbi:MAG: hypothetical protein WB505_11235, partial [Pseudolabrys sp.]